MQERQDWHKELLGQLDAEQKQISVTDPDARKLPTAHGTVVGYNAQLAVDAKHKLIAADDVTNEGTDLHQLADVALQAKTNLAINQAEVLADAGYYNAAEVSRCTRNKANRTITREANEPLMEAMAARMKQHPEKFKLRKTLAEHPFGTIKRWFGYTHFLLKGLAKVQCEWSLTTLAYNLKRVLNLVSFEKLMAAVG